MAGDGLRYDWDDADMQNQVRDSISHIEDMTPVMKAFAEYMVTRTDERFQDEKAPDGSGWKRLKPATLARKQKKGQMDKILQARGFLKLVHPEADQDSAGVYSNKIYAAIHNRGGQAGPGLKVTIPKREFLGFNQDDINEFQETVLDWIILGKA